MSRFDNNGNCLELTDQHGRRLQVGDKVLIPCTIVQVHHDPQTHPTVTTITVETVHGALRGVYETTPLPGGGPIRMYMDASIVEKAPAPELVTA